MNYTEILLPIIKEASKIMLSAHDVEGENAVSTKAGFANFVTVYDNRVQDYLISEIGAAIPNAKFVAEEKENELSLYDGECVFVIDPIDGTTNFIRDLSHSSISVACLSKGEVVFGAVYNPYLDEMYYAERGKGAYLNGRKISVSDREMKTAITLFGSSFYYRDELGERTFRLGYEYFNMCADLRRFASAAIDLCYIASGKAEVFFELRLSPWDYLAGAIIIEEAGGVITNIDRNPLSISEPSSVFASNKACYEIMMQTAEKYK